VHHVRLFTNYQIAPEEFALNLPNSSFNQPDYVLHLNESGPADLAIVLGHARPGMWVEGCTFGIVKLVQDPPQDGIFGRFTRISPNWATKTLTPFPESTYPLGRSESHAPIFNWLVGPSFDACATLEIPPKTRDISCIASVKRDLPGHRDRFEFVRQIERLDLGVDVFGSGRPNPLPFGKMEGLAPYRFSIAIENTSHRDYFTEKVFDCWLAGTVPVYFGAPNLSDFFPVDSFVQLPSLDIASFSVLYHEGAFSDEEYSRRWSAIEEARQLVIEKFSTHALISKLLKEAILDGVSESRERVRLSDFDSWSHVSRDFVARLIGRL